MPEPPETEVEGDEPVPQVHKVTFQIPVFTENYGRGYITMPQECENVNWRIGLLGTDEGQYGLQLMCNQEDRSNFWSLDMKFEMWLRSSKNEEENVRHGFFRFRARKFLILKLPLETVRLLADEKCGTYADFYITVLHKEGIRPKTIHDFSVRHPYLHNFTLFSEDKPIHCSKEILGMNSEVLLELIFPNEEAKLDSVKAPEKYSYEDMLRLIKVFYNESNTLDASNIDYTLQMATELKSINARQRCERWISKTPSMSAQAKLTMAEKYGLVELQYFVLQNECVGMMRTSRQVQRLFENPHNFSDQEIADLMNKVTLSIVGHAYDNSAK